MPEEKEAPPDSKMRIFGSEELFAGGREIAIRHNGSQYRLRVTKAGKLLLTK